VLKQSVKNSLAKKYHGDDEEVLSLPERDVMMSKVRQQRIPLDVLGKLLLSSKKDEDFRDLF